MKEQFVTYEIASKLKELGFDEECCASFDINYPSEQEIFQFPVRRFTNNHIKAPLWQQVIDWLRDKHYLWIETPMYIIQEGKLDGCYAYKAIVKSDEIYKEINIFEEDNFNCLSGARTKAILKAIELIK